MTNAHLPRVIYLLLDPDTLDVRYVGVTCRDPALRLACHISEAKTGKGHSHRANWISALLARGLRPELQILKAVPTCQRWQEAEIAVIAQYRANGARLVNGTDGGEGTTGRDWFPTDEWRRNVAAAQRGKRASPETRAKRSASLKRRYEDPAEMAKRRALGSAAGTSQGSRAAAAKRMNGIWSDPVLAAQMRERMKGAKARKRAAT